MNAEFRHDIEFGEPYAGSIHYDHEYEHCSQLHDSDHPGHQGDMEARAAQIIPDPMGIGGSSLTLSGDAEQRIWTAPGNPNAELGKTGS